MNQEKHKMFDNEQSIKRWLSKMKISAYHYKINSDLTVDVKYDVNLSNKKLTHIPVQFGKTYDFDCSNNKLTSLKGVPYSCSRFLCENNPLGSYQYLPQNSHILIVSDKINLQEFKNLHVKGWFSHHTKVSEDLIPELISQYEEKNYDNSLYNYHVNISAKDFYLLIEKNDINVEKEKLENYLDSNSSHSIKIKKL